MEENLNLETQPNDPIPGSEREEIQEDGGFFPWMKNVLVFITLFLVVIGSFWISFQLGKRLLLPIGRGEEKIKVAVPEPPAALQALQKKGMAESDGAAKKPKLALDLPAAPVVAVKPAVKRTAAVKRTEKNTKVAASGHYYKVQAAYFKNGKNAARLAEKIKAEGIDTFVKRIGSAYRVQTGAFRTRDEASALALQMKEKGFDSVILYE
jgi:hypothetical protein